MSQSKKELFLELVQPDKNGVSRWVSAIEFIGKYQGLRLGNGGVGAGITHLWLKNLNLIKGKLNSIDRIRLNGYNTRCVFNQSIRQDIKNYYSQQCCAVRVATLKTLK